MTSNLDTVSRFQAMATLIARGQRGFDDALHNLDRMEGKFGRSASAARHRRALYEAKSILEARVDGLSVGGAHLREGFKNFPDDGCESGRLTGEGEEFVVVHPRSPSVKADRGAPSA